MTRLTPNWIQQGNYAATNDRRVIGAIWPTEAVTGMVATAASGMTVNIAAGNAVVAVTNGSILCGSTGVEAVVIGAANATNPRIDLIVAQVRSNELDGGPDNDWIFQVVAGTPAASPVAPAEPARSVQVAQVYVAAGAVSISQANITDTRPRRLDQPWNTAWGIVGIAKVTSGNITGIGTGQNDLAGFSVTFPRVANRRYKVEAFVPQVSQLAATGTVQFYLKDDINQVRQIWRMDNVPVGSVPPIKIEYEYEPTTSFATALFKLAAGTTAGTLTVFLSGTQIGLVVVNDCGPVPGFGTLFDDYLDGGVVDRDDLTRPAEQ